MNLCYLLLVLLACLQGRGHDTLESVWPVVVQNFETEISSKGPPPKPVGSAVSMHGSATC